jgi:hypothetical protein
MTEIIQISPLIDKFVATAQKVDVSLDSLSREIFGRPDRLAKIKNGKVGITVSTYNKAIQRLNEIEAARCPVVAPAIEEQSV